MPGDQIIWSQYCHTYVFQLRWVKDIKFLSLDIQKMKSQKPFLDSKLERIEKKEYSDGSNIWKEGILRWVEYLTKTVWIASSRQRLLPHRGWFQRCLVKVDSVSKDKDTHRGWFPPCVQLIASAKNCLDWLWTRWRSGEGNDDELLWRSLSPSSTSLCYFYQTRVRSLAMLVTNWLTHSLTDV